jgi:type VI secretion system protein ImpC
MTKPWSLEFGGIQLGTHPSAADRELDPETPFRMLLLGDFSGRGSCGGSSDADWKPYTLDRDNFEQVMTRLKVEVRLTMPDRSEPLALRFAELDDFHPDRLYQRVPIFEELRQLRSRLRNPATFNQAADEVRSWGKLPPEPAPPKPPPEQPLTGLSGEELLELMLGNTPSAASRQQTADPLQTFIRKLVEPHVVPGASADETALLQVVDEVAAARMRAILHHPVFQAIEASWRALALLIRRLDTDGKLKLFVLDVSRDELAADLKATDLSRSRAYRVLIEQPLGTPGGVPWAVVTGNYTLTPTVADGVLASRLVHLCQAAGAPFLAGAHPAFLGCASLAATPDPEDWQSPPDPKGNEVWQAVRQLPQAAFLGLALPRFLLRQPYGAEGAVSESFTFEELLPDAGHEEYLWGNSAFLCALLLGQAYEHMGWRLRPGVIADVDSLPTWIRETDGERALLPCAETLLLDRAVNALGKRGLIAVQSMQGRDAVRIAQFPSLAEPPRTLAGQLHQ